MRRLAGLTIVASMLLVATSTIATAATSPSETTTRTAKVKAAGISLKYPKSWILVSLTKKGLAAQVKVVSKKNPKLAAAMAGTDLSQFKFRAIEPSEAFAENVQVQFVQAEDRREAFPRSRAC